MTGNPTRRSPAPSDFPQSSVGPLSRRQLIAGAGSAVGAGLILAGLGSAGAAALTSANPRLRPLSSGEPVTFGSNYSDPSSTARPSPPRSTQPASRRHDQHRRPQHVPGELQHLHPAARRRGVLVRRLPHAGVRGEGCRRRRLRRVGVDLPDFSEGFKNASTGLDGKQYFVPFYYYPWAVHYRKSLFEEKGYEIPTTWDELQGAVRPDADRWAHPARRRQRRQLAADGHVRHAQPAHQRLRLPRRR